MSKVVAVYKTGTGRDKKGTGHRDVCVGDFKSETVRTRDDREGLGDIKYGIGRGNVWDGDAGRQIQGRTGRGCE